MRLSHVEIQPNLEHIYLDKCYLHTPVISYSDFVSDSCMLLGYLAIKSTMRSINIYTLFVCIVTFSCGASVIESATDTELRQTITEFVNDILSKRDIKDLDTLENKSELLEERVQYLEDENRAKDIAIRDLQVNMNKMYKQLEGVLGNDFVRNTIRNEMESYPEHENNSERVKRQTTMSNVAFSAYLTHTQYSMRPGENIVFDRVILNDGSGYDSSTGIFQAPVSGTYLFTFHFDTHVHTFIRLSVDRRNQVDAVANPHISALNKEDDTMSGNTVIIHVGIAQKVRVEVYDVTGEAASSSTYRLCTFSGVLLYKEHTHA